METFGDKLYNEVLRAKSSLFLQGEFFQLTSQAFDSYIEYLKNLTTSKIDLTYPVGYLKSKKPILSTYGYEKTTLLYKYEHLKNTQMPLNIIFQLVTIIENLLVDILRNVLLEYPNKISSKKKFEYTIIHEAKSLEEVRTSIINSMINELTYKSPKEFAEEVNNYIGINLLEKTVYDDFIELKATRDIHIHNKGIVNEVYLNKAGPNARAKIGKELDINNQYLFESYECCIQITEIMEVELNNIWPSPIYEERKKQKDNKEKSPNII
jgi:hypothetical protein